jgi:hypothetical protein
LPEPQAGSRTTAQRDELVLLEVDLGGLVEEPAVDVPRLGVQAARGPRARAVEPLEQLAQVVGARSTTVLDEAIDDARVQVPFELAEVLCEQAPHRLQQEVATHVGSRRVAITETVVEVRHKPDGRARHRLL